MRITAQSKVLMLALCERRLADCGLSYEQVDSPEEAAERMARYGKPDGLPHMSIDRHVFLASNTFWVFLTDTDGEDVGSIAVRLDDLGDDTLLDYLSRQYRALYGGNLPINDLSNPRFPLSLGGKTVYIGDLYMRPTYRGGKRVHLRALIFLIYMLAGIDWPTLENIYAIVRVRFASRG